MFVFFIWLCPGTEDALLYGMPNLVNVPLVIFIANCNIVHLMLVLRAKHGAVFFLCFLYASLSHSSEQVRQYFIRYSGIL